MRRAKIKFDSEVLRRVVPADTVLEVAGHLVAALVLDPVAFRRMQEERHSESTSPTSPV